MRRAVHLVCTLAAAVALAAPLLFGPATTWTVRALSGGPAHACACGMTPGKCGCPECAVLEHERQQARRPRAYRVLRSSCEDDVPALNAAPLPTVTLPSYEALLAPVDAPRPALSRTDALHPRGRNAPPTPPPRFA